MTTQPPGAPQWWQPPQPHQQPHQGGGHQGPPPATPPAGQPHGHGFGGPFPSQYGGFGAFDPPKERKPGKSRTPLVAAVLVVVALAGGGIAAWLLGAFNGDVLDQDALHRDIATVLRNSYGEHDISDVRCPEDQRIAAGHTFECSVTVAGRPRTVPIRILNDKPEYEVGAPR